MRIRRAKTLVFGIGIFIVFSAPIFIFAQPAYAQAPSEVTCPLEKKEGGIVPCGRQCDDPKTSINEKDQCNFCHFFYLFERVFNFFMWRIVPAAALLFVVYAGFVFVTSRGSPTQLTTAKNILIWTFAGYAIVFISWMVLNSIFAGLGVAKWTGLTEGWWQFSCGTREVKKEPVPEVIPPSAPPVEPLLEEPTVTRAATPLAWPEPETLKWTKFNQGPWVSKVNHRAVVFEDPQDENRQKILVIGGRSQDVTTSEVLAFDGVKWEQKSSLPAPREEHAALVFDGKIWVIGGREGGRPKPDVWAFDGKSWEAQTPLPSGRYGHAAVIFQNKIWVIGGQERVIGNEDRAFALEDKKWVAKERFPVRIVDHAALVFGGKIWVIGGSGEVGNEKRVWAFDGTKWIEISSKVPENGITGSHAATVFDDGTGEKIWVLGGYSARRAQASVWTFDGAVWQAMASLPSGAGRIEHGAVVFKDPRDDKQKIWSIGGFDATGVYANDLWVYTPPALRASLPPVTKVVFVTSSEYGADLTFEGLDLDGAQGADARCQELAGKAKLNGAYRAWLSASNRSPSTLTSFMQHNVPYVLTDGTKIAENWQGIVDGYLQVPINLTEKKEVVSDRYVWTATNIYGKLDEGDQHCENWSTNESPIFTNAQLGNTSFKDARWTQAGANVRCESKRSLYCLEQ